MKSAIRFKVGSTMSQVVAQAWDRCVRLLYERTLLVLTILICAGAAAMLVHLHFLSTSLGWTAALQGTSMHSRTLEDFRSLYASEVAEIEDIWFTIVSLPKGN